MDKFSTGVYRYSADDQVYMINLNVSSSNGRFQQGMNTIILPRAIALQCQLNDTLYDLASLSSGDSLYGASFYSTDPASTSASAHVIAVISKDVTATQAEVILTKLTHNSTGARIGNNVTISSTALYLLHLPNDILSTIPTFVKNAGMGEGPNYLNPLGIISNIAGMAFDFLVWVASGGVLLLLAHLVQMGMGAIGNLLSAAASAVQDAVDAIVDAFCAFVDWMVDMLLASLDALFSRIISSIENAITSYCLGVDVAYRRAEQDVIDFGGVNGATLNMIFDALFSQLFMLILGVAISLTLILDAFTCISGGMTFLLALLISPIIGYIMNEVIKAFDYDKFTGAICDTFEGIWGWMIDVFGPGEDPPQKEQIAWEAGSFMMGVVGSIYSSNGLLGRSLLQSVCFACGIVSIILGIYATAVNSIGCGILGIALGVIPIIHTTVSIRNANLDNRILAGIVTAFGAIGIICSYEGL